MTRFLKIVILLLLVGSFDARKNRNRHRKLKRGVDFNRDKRPRARSLSWLYLANSDDCEQKYLSYQQREICRKYPDFFAFIKKAAKDTVAQCVLVM